MSKGIVRDFFAGGNTCLGFYSLYNNVIQQKDALKIFIIKGGPGVGKSTFMKNIGIAMLEKGYDIENFWCSSDNNSLDGIVIKNLNVGIMDGTAPHVIDPKTPGAVDEIINLGDHWNEAKLIKNKMYILKDFKKVSRCFQTAYSSLKGAKVIHDEWMSYISECVDFRKVNKITHQIIEKIFTNIERQYEDYLPSRELFADAITPMGLVNQWPSILQNCKKVFVLRGEPGTGKSTIIQRIIVEAKSYGLYTEVFRSSFDPAKFSGVHIPKLQTAVINPLPNSYTLNGIIADIVEIDLNTGLLISRLSSYDKEISECSKRFWGSINRAINYIDNAKRIHDELEQYYKAAMDFSKITELRNNVLQKIINLA